MRRRDFITLIAGVAAAWPFTARAQPSGARKIGVLIADNPDPTSFLNGLRAGLRDLGYGEGRDIRFEIRLAGGQASDLTASATELVALKVDVIAAYTTRCATAAQQATKNIPIVMEVADATGTGLISSLARPGGNITGVSANLSELAVKNLELIRELLPAARRIAVLVNVADPFGKPFLDHIRAVAGPMKVEIKPTMVQPTDRLEEHFTSIEEWRADALLVQPSLAQQRIADLSLQHRLPAACATPKFAKLGGLISYSADYDEVYRRVAIFVDKILKGRKPADLPVELPTKFWLSVNLKTAKALGVAVPPTILARVDELVE